MPGYENPATLCYVPLGSAEWAKEGVRAVLRCAGVRARHAAPGGGGGGGGGGGDGRRRVELLCREAVPLMRTALRTCLDAETAVRDASMARALFEVSALLSRARWSGGLRVEQVGAGILRADRCTIFLYDGGNHPLIAFVAEGLGTREIVLPLDEAQDAKVGVAGACANTKETINIEDAYLDGRFNRSVDEASGYRTRSILAMPFESVSSGELMGVVQVINKLDDEVGGPQAFDEDDERLLHTTLKLAALAIENVQLADQYAGLMRQYREARKSVAK